MVLILVRFRAFGGRIERKGHRGLEQLVQKAKTPMLRPPPPCPQRLAKQNGENQFKKFIDMMKSLSINVPLVEALEQMLSYAKFMKDLVTKKRSMNCETIKMTHQVSAIEHSMAPKLEDPNAFTIPCTIRSAKFAKVICDLGASINLMPYSVFKTLGIGKPRPTSMRLQMDDRTMKRLLGVIEDVLVRVDKFILSADFVILDCEVDYEVPIILGRPFLTTGKALVDVESRELTFRVGDEKVVFHVCKSMRNPIAMSDMMNVDDTLEAVLLNFDDEEMEAFVEYVESTLAVLQKRKKAIGWTLADIWGISPASCMHKINLEEGAKPSIEHQRRLNEAMQEVFKKEIIKWLDVGVVYHISDSSWTSVVQCILKKGGMTVVTNDKNELIPTRTVTGWRRMPFGLCNAPATFQRYMMAIFTDMVEDYLEIFMDDFSVVGNFFFVIVFLNKVLARCEETNLVLNWEKCDFMVEEDIVLGHKILKNGIEVDKAKIELLEKDVKFHFNDDYMRALNC
ncbi:uncharacterized protein [Nicotiana sylvestris]|uniref:uncharacterized protein n=1 Tax=Nicotiana sylvestris TaxID=4096 RepID=UPI00388C8F21